jgi:hypothetical protein
VDGRHDIGILCKAWGNTSTAIEVQIGFVDALTCAYRARQNFKGSGKPLPLLEHKINF